MKDLDKYLEKFQNKVKREYMYKIEGGIIDSLLRRNFKGKYAPSCSFQELLDQIICNEQIAYSVFEKHFLKTNLRFNVFYNGKNITTKKMKEQIPTLLNILPQNIYTSVKKLNKHLFDSVEDAQNSYKQYNKTLNIKNITQLNSGKFFDSSFNGTNPTTNVRPILDELIKLDPKLKYTNIPEKGFNQELINCYLK